MRLNVPKPVITLLTSAAAQSCALVIGHIFWNHGSSLLLAVMAAAGGAAVCGFLLRMRPEILALNILMPFAAITAFDAGFVAQYGAWFLPFACFMALLFAPTIYSGVPYYPTHRKVYDEIRKLLPTDKAFHFIDLGCGDGRLLAYLASHFPNATFSGCELSPLAWFFAKVRCFYYGSRVNIQFKDLWSTEITKADFIYNFLAPPVMPRLWMKLSVEAKPGSTLISNAFEFPVEADRVVRFVDDKRSSLYIYHKHQ